MTVENLPRSVVYKGDGTTTTFPVPFQFFEIKVTVDGGLVTTGYSISQPDGSGQKGSVVFESAPAANASIIVSGKTELRQPADYVEGDGFPAETHELVLDRITMALQELRAAYDANPQFPADEPDVVPGVDNETNIYIVVDGVGYLVPAALFLSASNDPSGIGRAHNVGDIVYRAIAEVPPGWIALKTERQTVAKVEYPEWTAKCEAEDWPYGHTTTHVGIPSIGDGFFRAWDGTENTLDPDAAQRRDNENGTDIVGNIIGSRQGSAVGPHPHPAPDVEASGTFTGAAVPAHRHFEFAAVTLTPDPGGTDLIEANEQPYRWYNAATNNGYQIRGTSTDATVGRTSSGGGHTPSGSVSVSVDVGNIPDSEVSTETYPGNVAFQAIMLLRPGDAAAQHATLGLPYLFSEDTEVEDPGEGFITFNNATVASATAIIVSNLTAFGAEPASLFSAYDNYPEDQETLGTVTVYASGQIANSAVFRVTGPATFEDDYFSIPVAYSGGGGTFSDNAPVSIMPTFDGARGQQGVGELGPVGDPGDAGWSPKFAVASDGARRVLQLAGYVGGEGDTPTDHVGDYVGASDYTSTIGDAVDIRGPAGANGDGAGNVVGPESSTSGNIAVFDDSTGELLADSGVAVSTDDTFAADSDAKVPTEKATKAFIAAVLAAGDFAAMSGGIDCSTEPNYPAADAGDTYRVTVAGKIGGASGPNVQVGDAIQCFVDSSSSGDHATVGANWIIIQTNLEAASTTVQGFVELATSVETSTGTDATRAVTPDGLAGSDYGKFVLSLQVVHALADVVTGDGADGLFWRVPAAINGYNLVGVAAQVATAGSTGTTDIQVRRVRSGSPSDMLSTKITIDSGETDSATAATPSVINASNDDVQTADTLFIDVDAVSTTKPKGLVVELTFQLP